MTTAELFTAVGRALFGERWKADMDQALGIRAGRSDDWSKGRGAPSPAIWLELAGIIQDREAALPRLKVEVLALSQRPG